MKTQIWIAEYVPELIPDWVNPAISIWYDANFKKYFIFEIDPEDEIFYRCKSPDGKAMRLLRAFGFKKPIKIYQGLSEEMFLSPQDYPPTLSVSSLK